MGIRNDFRAFVGGFVLLFFTTNVLMAYTPEKNFWVERRQSAARRASGTILAKIPTVRSLPFVGLSGEFGGTAPQLLEKTQKNIPSRFLKDHADLLRSLPYAEGSVRKISLPSVSSTGGPVVIHIQDVHQNPEAQGHIAVAVAALASRVDLIGLEGSTRILDLARFRAFPDRNAVAIAAEESLAQNEITGPIHAALTAKEPFPSLVGIDDPRHYAANIEAYRQSAVRVANEKEKRLTRITTLESQKRIIYNPTLLNFDKEVTDYRAGRASLSSYVNSLKMAVPRLSSELRRFSEALALEEQIDFQAVESDRVRAVEVLAARLDQNALSQLTAEGTAYRAGAIQYGDFYRYLRDLCARHGVTFGKDLETYIRYVLLADSVDAGALFDKLHAMETAAYNRLSTTKAEKDLIARCRQSYLTGKLVDFALTPEEWEEYQAVPTPGLETFESFYREAHARDGAMARNLLSALSQIKPNKPASVGLLVTGGYHAPGLTRELIKAGVTVISFVPKIEKMDTADGPVALGIFTREKTPLQKLFEGEKLFLGQDPLPEYEKSLAIPAKISVTTIFDPKKTFSRLVGSLLQGRISNVKKFKQMLLVKFKNGDQMKSAFDPSAPKGSKFTLRITPSIKESVIALFVAGLMGVFYFVMGVIYPPLFGHLSRPQSLLFILGTGILNGFTSWVLVNRAQKASHLPTISLGPILGLQVLFFGPLYGFVGNELLRLIPGIGFVPSYWVQALVGQIIVAPLVFDPLGYFVLRRFISREPVSEILQSMKKKLLPYVILNALLWTPIGALGLSFPNNAATNIVASVGGILATLVGNLFVIRGKLGFLMLDFENTEKIRSPAFRSMAQGMVWFYSRPWFSRYLITLVGLGYSTLVGIMVHALIPNVQIIGLLSLVTFLLVVPIFRNFLLRKEGGASPFNVLDRTLSGVGWGLLALNGWFFGIDLFGQGHLLFGGAVGLLSIYPALIALRNIQDAVMAGGVSLSLRSSGPRGPPDQTPIQKAQLELGLIRHQVVSSLDDLNAIKEKDNTLIIIPSELMSSLADERGHLLPLTTLGLTDFDHRTVYLSDLAFSPDSGTIRPWAQTYVRSILVAREKQRLSPSYFSRSAMGIDLKIPLRFLKTTSTVPSDVIDQAAIKAVNTFRLIEPGDLKKKLAIEEAWRSAMPLGLSKADGALAWVRGMKEQLRSPEFRKAYAEELAARKARLPPLLGPSDILRKFHVSMSPPEAGMTGRTVPLLIVSSEGMGEVEKLLNGLDQMNQGGGKPIHVVLAGSSDDAVNRINTLKGLRPFVHVVESPVALNGIVDPAVLLAGIQAVPKITELGSISWWVALSPGIRLDPETIAVLGDDGLAGSLKSGLAALLRVLDGQPLKPVDLNTLIDIAALVLGSA